MIVLEQLTRVARLPTLMRVNSRLKQTSLSLSKARIILKFSLKFEYKYLHNFKLVHCILRLVCIYNEFEYVCLNHIFVPSNVGARLWCIHYFWKNTCSCSDTFIRIETLRETQTCMAILLIIGMTTL
jgi:hypothetical protein